MFHTWPVKISRTDPSSTPNCLLGKSAAIEIITPGRKLSTGDGLQRVEQRNHEALGLAVVGSYVSVHQREDETEYVRDGQPQNGEQRIFRQRRRMKADFRLRANRARPIAGKCNDAVKQADSA